MKPSGRKFLSLPTSRRLVDREVDEEIRFHIDARVADLIARGFSPSDAQAHAVREYGDLSASHRELAQVDRRRVRRERWTAALDGFSRDVVYTTRSLVRRPGFTLSLVSVLALGIGANATMFGVIDRLLLRPPAHVTNPERVMRTDYVRSRDGEADYQDVLSYPMYTDLRDTKGAFEQLAAYSSLTLAVGRGADAQRLRGMRATANFFSALGARPLAGRFFLAGEDAPTGALVVVISYGYWKRQFNGDPKAVGQTVVLGDSRYTIIGVAPRGFTGVGQTAVDAWIPITAGVSEADYRGWTKSRQGFWLWVVARLPEGGSRARAAAIATEAIRAGALRDGVSAQRIAEQQPRIAFTSVLPREARANVPDAKVALLLGAVSLLVLLIACANVANLQLARGFRRRREIAVRIALGISRGRLIAQLLTESVLIALVGGVAALTVAYWGSELVRRVLFTNVDWSAGPAIDTHVLGYTALAALIAGIASGIVPAFQASSPKLATSLKEGAREGRVHHTRTRTTLLIVQTALSVVLLVGTGLFTRSLVRINALPLGMEPNHVLTAYLETTGVHYTSAEIDALYRRMTETARTTPGIEAAALSTTLPFYTSWGTRVSVPGRDSLPTTRDGGPYFTAVTGGYFETMGMRLLRGRAIADEDRAASPRVVVINESMAKLWWPNEDAIGRCMRVGGDTVPCAQIVGVVANARRQELIEDVSLQFFLPIEQAPAWSDSRILVVRPRGDAVTSIDPLRRRLQAVAPNLPYVDVRPMQELVNPQMHSWRLGATMFGAFGALALLLAAVGLYSMLSYDVAQRMHELAVRVALGARGGDLASMVVRSAMPLVIVGGGIGLMLTLSAGPLVQPLLFHTSPREPIVLFGVVVILVLVSIVAALVPVRRAVAVDPIDALRADA
jgi:predicted permease